MLPEKTAARLWGLIAKARPQVRRPGGVQGAERAAAEANPVQAATSNLQGVIEMPGFNGTGPLSSGPMTGRGRGFCMMEVGSGTFLGAGCGRGRGYGWRRLQQPDASRGRRLQGAYWLPAGDNPDDKGREDIRLLKDRVRSSRTNWNRP
ncbi:MAG: DUF5320 domain-containing protein [Bacillota bacterium]